MSPELQAAVAAAAKQKRSPVRDRRGFFAIGPGYFGASDLLIFVLWYLMADGSAAHYSGSIRPDIIQQRKTAKLNSGRSSFRRKQRNYEPHGRAEFYGAITAPCGGALT